MRVPTIEETFEYRIKDVIAALLDDHEMPAVNFRDGEALLDYLYKNADDFGQRIIDDMTVWAGEDHWLDLLD